MGWRVASCLPDTLAATGSTTSLRRHATRILVVAALVAAAVLLASIVLNIVARRQRDRAPRGDKSSGIDAIEARLDAIEARLHAREA
jgi:hypothetical protein